MKPHRSIVLAVMLVALGGIAGTALAQMKGKVAGLPADEAMKLGERMYREGVLSSGEPMMALVAEDIEVESTMFSCSSCHLRSGRGSLEGTVITLPTCGSWLYKPLIGREMKPIQEERLPAHFDPPPYREAYTDELVARAIWTGKDPNGREFNWVMPRYRMSTTDMEILVHYLKNLSATFSPGVDETTIRFATVVSDGVSPQDRAAMLDALQAHVRDHNSQVRHNEKRVEKGPWEMDEMYGAYRRYSLAVWELKGDRSTWPAQLEAFYREEPVFALLGGIATGEWAPIHDFCERHQVPCMFPITAHPVISETDWYTLYFDKGSYQEGDAAARFLRRVDGPARDAPVVQVYRDSPAGRDAAAGFAAARSSMGLPPPTELVVGPEQTVDAAFWSRLTADHPGAVLALWLQAGELSEVAALAAAEQRSPLIFASAGLLGDVLDTLPGELRSITFVTYPGSLPEDAGRSRLAVEGWLRAKGLPVTNYEIQARLYFLGWTLSQLVHMMRDDFYRDYFLDIADMMRDEYYAVASIYPRLSFGPGQRYASKGCYVVQLDDSDPPKLVKRSDWVIH